MVVWALGPFVNRRNDDAWQEAKRRCRLSGEEVRMAKELGFQPNSLIKSIPSPSEKWKAPVSEWVRSLYEKKFGSRRRSPPPAHSGVLEFGKPDDPWPDHPEIPELRPEEMLEFDPDDRCGAFEPPDGQEIQNQAALALGRQRLMRWAAQVVAVALSKLAEVEKVAAFGPVAQPLELEVPRFNPFRRFGIKVPHECADLDLAVWMSNLGRLKELQRALSRSLALVQDTPYGGVAHHQVDVHLFEAGSNSYRGRLCIFGVCPKPGKLECRVPGCGAEPFLRQFARYRFNPEQFEAGPRVILFDRAGGFLVRPPRIESSSNSDLIPY